MKIIGLTGGIGSGKSTVAKMLESWGVPLYNSDLRARELMNESCAIKSNLKQWYGEDIYLDGRLDRKKLGAEVFANQEQLTRLNQLVHPIVYKDFKQWVNQQTAPYILKEAAILFEAGSYKDCDIIITVSAPEALRIQRVIERDNTSKSLVLDRISKQWTDAQRESKSNYVIHNNGTLDELEKKVRDLYLEIKDKRLEE